MSEFNKLCPADYNNAMQSDSDYMDDPDYTQEAQSEPTSPKVSQDKGGSFDEIQKSLQAKRDRISREGEEADEIILRQGYFFRETITLLPMQRPVLYAMYNAIYDAWLTYRNYHIYLHLLDADSDYDIEDNYMHFINDDCDENSDNDEGSDSHEGIESLDCNCRCRHYSVDNNTEDEYSENEVSDDYKDDDTGDEHSEN